jgi:hypothetical protein
VGGGVGRTRVSAGLGSSSSGGHAGVAWLRSRLFRGGAVLITTRWHSGCTSWRRRARGVAGGAVLLGGVCLVGASRVEATSCAPGDAPRGDSDSGDAGQGER